jgi:hypothetical protein
MKADIEFLHHHNHMQDPHLNLFYTYNRDEELIENNLTRAFIVTLELLAPQSRARLLTSLLGKHRPETNTEGDHIPPDFTGAKFALQGYMDRVLLKRFTQKYILAIASNRYEDIEEAGEAQPVSDLPVRNYSSIPDAWIYDANMGYCYLIEAKVGHNPLDSGQIIAHAHDWLGIRKLTKVHERFISITWLDVIKALHEIKSEDLPENSSLNIQEIKILDNFEEFLNLFGYKRFTGIHFDNFKAPPEFHLGEFDLIYSGHFDFSNLPDPPQFHLSVK